MAAVQQQEAETNDQEQDGRAKGVPSGTDTKNDPSPAPREELLPEPEISEETDILSSLKEEYQELTSDDSALEAIANTELDRRGGDEFLELPTDAERINLSPDALVNLIETAITDPEAPNIQEETRAIEKYLEQEFGRNQRGTLLVPKNLRGVWKTFTSAVSELTQTNPEAKTFPENQRKQLLSSLRLVAQGIETIQHERLPILEQFLGPFVGKEAEESAELIRSAIADNKAAEAAKHLTEISSNAEVFGKTFAALQIVGVEPSEVVLLLSQLKETSTGDLEEKVEEVTKNKHYQKHFLRLERLKERSNTRREEGTKGSGMDTAPSETDSRSAEEIEALHKRLTDRLGGEKEFRDLMKLQENMKSDTEESKLAVAEQLHDWVRQDDQEKDKVETLRRFVFSLRELAPPPEQARNTQAELKNFIKDLEYRGYDMDTEKLLDAIDEAFDVRGRRGARNRRRK